MKKTALQIIPAALLEQYCMQVDTSLPYKFDALRDAETSTRNLSFYTSVSAISSSRIEGEPMEVDSYLKHKMLNIAYQPNLVEKPNDLYNAYLFAQAKERTKFNFLEAHILLAKHLLPKKNKV